jgi:ribosomal-protein-alanine N-acetyltransferase
MWLAFDEAHITTIGVDPDQRGRGLGELLLLCMFDEAVARGANWLTLEVRVTNAAAQALYRKYGFTAQGTRKRYYSDNNEDALIMWSPALGEAEFRAEVESRRAALERRLGNHLAPGSLSPFPGPASWAGAS